MLLLLLLLTRLCICYLPLPLPSKVCQRPAVTPRQWLDQRWQRQAGSSSHRHKLAAAAVDLPLPPTRSFLATQNSNSNGGSSSSSTLHWDSLLVSSAPRQLLVAKPALPSQALQQQLPKLANGHEQRQKRQKQQQQQQRDSQQQQHVSQHAASAHAVTEAGQHSWAVDVHGPAHITASISVRSKSSSSKLSSIAQSKQLMAAIKAARSVEQLQQLYSNSSSSMDLLHCTSMLNRLAHAWDGLQRKARATSSSGSSSSRHASQRELPTGAAAAAAAAANLHSGGIGGSSLQAGQVHGRAQGQLQPAEVTLQHHQQQQQARVAQRQQRLQALGVAAVRLLESLLSDLQQQQHLAACSSRQLSSCLWVIGCFSRAAAGSAVLQQAAAALLGQLLAAAPAEQPGRLGGSLNGHAAAVVPQQELALHGVTVVLPLQELVLHDHSMQGSSSVSVVSLQQRLTGQQSHWQQQQQHDELGQQQQQQGLVLDGANMADLGNTLWALGRLAQVSRARQHCTAAHGSWMLCWCSSFEEVCTADLGISAGCSSCQHLLILSLLNVCHAWHALTQLAAGLPPQVVPMHSLFPQQQQQLQAALSLLEQACCRQLHPTSACNGRFVANCLYGFAHLGQPVPALFSALVTRLGFNYCQQLQSQHVVIASWALAKLGHYDASLTTRLLWRAVVVRQALQTRGVGLLVWSAGKQGHAADPRAVAQLLQAFKQHAGKARGKDLSLVLYGLHALGLLQQHRAWLLDGCLQLVLQRLQDMQPAGIATLLSALLALSRSDAAAAAEQQQASAASAAAGAARLPMQSGEAHAGQGHVQADSLLLKRLQQPGAASPTAAAAAVSGAATPHVSSSRDRPNNSSSQGLLDPRHMAPLYREVARRIAAQLQHTTPQTLASISLSLAGLGYYDARLYTRLAAALAAAAAPEAAAASAADAVQAAQRQMEVAADAEQQHDDCQQQEQQSQASWQLPYSTQQCVRLLCMFAHFQHPAPALWHAVLPNLAAQHAEDAGSSSSSCLQPRAVVQLLAASTSAGCAGTASVLQGLLQLAVALLQQHQGSLAVTDLVQLAAAGSWLHNAPQQQVVAAGAGELQPLLLQLDRHLQRLLPRLVSAVLSQPHLLPPQHLPKLLEAAVQLQQSSSSGMWSSSSSFSSIDDNADLVSKHHSHQQHHHSTQHVGHRQLQRLSDLAIEQLGFWQPPALVSLLNCHTQPPLYDPLLAEAYAEELVPRLSQASLQVLLQLLRVLATASQQQNGYSHSQLLAAAVRQLHGRLLLATEQQLGEAVVLLEQLQQQEAPVYRAAVRLLEGWGDGAAAVQQGEVVGVRMR
jgi:hypothetical protein